MEVWYKLLQYKTPHCIFILKNLFENKSLLINSNDNTILALVTIGDFNGWKGVYKK